MSYDEDTVFVLEDLPAYFAESIDNDMQLMGEDEYVDDAALLLYRTPYAKLKSALEKGPLMDDLIDLLLRSMQMAFEQAAFISELYDKDVTIRCCYEGCSDSAVGNSVHEFSILGSTVQRAAEHTPYPTPYIAVCPLCWDKKYEHHEFSLARDSPEWKLLQRLVYESLPHVFDDDFHDRIMAYAGPPEERGHRLVADLETADLSALPKDRKGCYWDNNEEPTAEEVSRKRLRQEEKELIIKYRPAKVMRIGK